MSPRYAELRVTSHFSFLRGAGAKHVRVLRFFQNPRSQSLRARLEMIAFDLKVLRADV